VHPGFDGLGELLLARPAADEEGDGNGREAKDEDGAAGLDNGG
jgi:hypothetical protein